MSTLSDLLKADAELHADLNRLESEMLLATIRHEQLAIQQRVYAMLRAGWSISRVIAAYPDYERQVRAQYLTYHMPR
jgi:hypothetical protein